MGRNCFVSSGLRIWRSAIFVRFLLVIWKSVRLAILTLIRLLCAVASAVATSDDDRGCFVELW